MMNDFLYKVFMLVVFGVLYVNADAALALAGLIAVGFAGVMDKLNGILNNLTD